MKFPWVSRAAHDEAMLFIREETSRTIARLERANAEIFAAYKELRHSGANPKEAERVIEAKPIDPIVQAINLASRGDGALRSAMWRQVEIDRKAGLSNQDIATRIMAGFRPAEEVAQ